MAGSVRNPIWAKITRTAALGLSFRWTESTEIELALRTTDLGELGLGD